MKKLDLQVVADYVAENVGTFHQKRLMSIERLSLKAVLKRKNPYLFRAKNILIAQDLVSELLNAFLQSQEETLFGTFTEDLAIFISSYITGGKKPTNLVGIDLEFERDGKYYIVEIKSGPSWGNSSQIKKMQDNFAAAKAKLADTQKEIIAVNGCCYGKDDQPDKGFYFKYCGQRFWEFVSGEPSLYTDIIEPFGHKAKEKNEAFAEAYAKILNRFTAEFIRDFCNSEGAIDWKKLVEYNSAAKDKPSAKA